MVSFTDEQKVQLETLVAAGYSLKQLAIYFKINEENLQHEFNDKNSEFRECYERGMLLSKAKLDIISYEKAIDGNINAMQRLDKSIAQRDFITKRDQMLYEDTGRCIRPTIDICREGSERQLTAGSD
jgi:hypothetical protein